MATDSPAAAAPLPVSVIVPARNAAAWLPGCLASVRAQDPAELIVVDGESSDETVAIAESFGARIFSDGGRGVPAARMLGARHASQGTLALVDADVVIPQGALAVLLEEFISRDLDGLQFALVSECLADDYWGQALAWHHNHSRVRSWFGVCATLIERDCLLENEFDESFRSGEDIELRMRLQRKGARLAVSTGTAVRHRFAPGLATAMDQWTQDGAGLARAALKHPDRAAWTISLPLLATARGVALALVIAPRYLPYWAGFLVVNYAAMARQLASQRGHHRRLRTP